MKHADHKPWKHRVAPTVGKDFNGLIRDLCVELSSWPTLCSTYTGSLVGQFEQSKGIWTVSFGDLIGKYPRAWYVQMSSWLLCVLFWPVRCRTEEAGGQRKCLKFSKDPWLSCLEFNAFMYFMFEIYFTFNDVLKKAHPVSQYHEKSSPEYMSTCHILLLPVYHSQEPVFYLHRIKTKRLRCFNSQNPPFQGGDQCSIRGRCNFSSSSFLLFFFVSFALLSTVSYHLNVADLSNIFFILLPLSDISLPMLRTCFLLDTNSCFFPIASHLFLSPDRCGPGKRLIINSITICCLALW